MTLNTEIRFLGDVDPERVFGITRTMLGITNEFSTDRRDGFVFFNHHSCGAAAAVDMTVAIDSDAEHDRWCTDPGKDCDCSLSFPSRVRINLDTTYGYSGQHAVGDIIGLCPGCHLVLPTDDCQSLHMWIIHRLACEYEYELIWQDEFTGDWYSPFGNPKTKNGMLLCRTG